MKKQIKLLAAVSIILIMATMALPKLMHAATQYHDPDVMYQTWEEFLESGVQLEYEKTSEAAEDINE